MVFTLMTKGPVSVVTIAVLAVMDHYGVKTEMALVAHARITNLYYQDNVFPKRIVQRLTGLWRE